MIWPVRKRPRCREDEIALHKQALEKAAQEQHKSFERLMRALGEVSEQTDSIARGFE